jgi:nondiscriminating glutamyl-tRNA synthetase
MSEKTVVRFPPSPTGNLHIGTARTALFNYLLAKKHAGKLILRIEDTDRERSTIEFEKNIFTGLAWLGIDPDEGPEQGGPHGPYRQSERGDIYNEHIKKLLDSGAAYPCYCTPEELEATREDQKKRGEAPRYNGRCRNLNKEERSKFESEGRKSVVRFKVPEGKKISFIDLVRGEISFQTNDIGDFVIQKSDGTPLYNVANVVDDALMGVTHVIRGEDLISSTPNQILIGSALDFSIPKFAHLPLLLGADHSKLSKRHGATAVDEYQEKGYLPEALINFMVLLGWSPPGEEDFLTMETLEKTFDLDRVQKGGAIVDLQKLDHLNGEHIRALSPSELTSRLHSFIPEDWFADHALLERSVATVQERLVTLRDASDMMRFYFEPPKPVEVSMDTKSHIVELNKLLAQSSYEQEKLNGLLHSFLEANKLGPKDLFPALRLILTGEKVSPPINLVMWALGADEVKKRLLPYIDKV